MKEGQHLSTKRRGFILLAIILMAVFGVGYITLQSPIQLPGKNTAAATPTPAYQTAPVRQGNLTISINGTGAVVPAQTINLGFGAPGGNVAQINVQAGDHVTQGQALASLDNIDQLKLTVANDQLALQTAQQTLTDLQNNAAATLDQASVNQANAQIALVSAENNVHSKGDPTCDANTTEKYYYQYTYAQQAVTQWEGYLSSGKTGYGKLYIEQQLNGLRRTRDIAEANYQFCQGYTSQEVLASQVALQLAQAKFDQATANYQSLKANSGIDPLQMAIDQAAVKSAQLQLAKDQKYLSGATIVAPVSGTITAVNGVVGQPAGGNKAPSSSAISSATVNTSSTSTSASFITISDMDHPQVQVNIDESDLENFAVGCPSQVTFTSLPNQTFQGTVSEIYPSLVTVQGASMAQGLISFTGKSPFTGMPTPQGLTASVTITCHQAQNVLQIPVQALYQPTGQPSYVYVLNAAGQPEKRTVTTGLNTGVYVEIKSGLSAGERVITTPIQGK